METTLEEALDALRGNGYNLFTRYDRDKNLTDIEVEDWSLSWDEHIEEMKKIIGDNFIFQRLPNTGMISLTSKK